MHFSALLVLAAGAFVAEAASLSNCNQGLAYCGNGLLRKGNYNSDILNSLSQAGQPTDQAHIDWSLFLCDGPDNIPFLQFCGAGRCVDGGSGQSDHC